MLKLLHLLHALHRLPLRIDENVFHVEIIELVNVVFALYSLLEFPLRLLQ